MSGGPETTDSWSWDTVESILQAGRPIATSCTGGGSRAVSWLFNHPGASRALVEAQIPYHAQAIDNYLGLPGPHRAVEETARRLAAVARRRARQLSGDGAVGLGASAALATDRERRGADRAYIAARSQDQYEFVALQFDKCSDRLAQEEILSATMLSTLARRCECQILEPAMPAWVQMERCTTPVDEDIEGLLDGLFPTIALGMSAAGDAKSVPWAERLLVSGSFNPLHEGHAGLADAAERCSGRETGFELSVNNVDKPALPYTDVLRRLAQPRQGRGIALTREPTFLGKARLLKGCWFAIGYDTALRLVEPAYYDGTTAGMTSALAELRDLNCRFYVAGRQWQGDYRGLADVPLPKGFSELFAPIPESEFRLDISSTTLRQGRK